jgi:hypothetical protein
MSQTELQNSWKWILEQYVKVKTCWGFRVFGRHQDRFVRNLASAFLFAPADTQTESVGIGSHPTQVRHFGLLRRKNAF